MVNVDWSCSQMDLQVRLKTRMLNQHTKFILFGMEAGKLSSIFNCLVPSYSFLHLVRGVPIGNSLCLEKKNIKLVLCILVQQISQLRCPLQHNVKLSHYSQLRWNDERKETYLKEHRTAPYLFYKSKEIISLWFYYKVSEKNHAIYVFFNKG